MKLKKTRLKLKRARRFFLTSLPKLGFLALSLSSSLVFAETAVDPSRTSKLNFTHHDEVKKSSLAIGIEFASLGSTPSLSGFGFNVSYDYAFSSSLRLRASSVQMFNLKGLSYLYTELSLSPQYALVGSFISEIHELGSAGGLVARETEIKKHTLSLGLGAEQLLLTGSTQVYPASGITAQAYYTVNVLKKWWEIGARLGSFTSNSKNFSAMFLNLSTPFEI